MLQPGTFKVWIAPLKAKVTPCGLELEAPSAYAARWLEGKLLPDLRRAAAPVLGLAAADVQVRIVAAASGMNGACTAPEPAGLPLPQPPLKQLSVWRHSFEDFVVGPSNNLAAAAAQEVSRGGAVHTLYVNAGSGLGKTHLMQAVGQAVSQVRGAVRVAYMTAEEFASRFVAALRVHDVDAFKAVFRDLDILLLEDVHFFQGKEKMQDMALTVIKAMQARGGRVVFTSSFAPHDLQRVDSQLVSHFCSGILAQIGRPTVDMRCEILDRKARCAQVHLPGDVRQLLASRLDGDVRQLEACLNSLIFKARVLRCGINAELALDIVSQFAPVAGALDISTITRLVCESYGLSQQQLASRSRRREYVQARNTAFYLARKHTELTLGEIGLAFNRRHSTVVKGITSIERELARQSPLGRQLGRAVALIERNAGVAGQ